MSGGTREILRGIKTFFMSRAPFARRGPGACVARGAFIDYRPNVTLGARLAGWVEVVGGVAAGDRIVVAGQQRLTTPSARVRLSSAPALAADVAASTDAPDAPEAAAASPAPALQWHRMAASGNPCAVARS